MYLCKKNVFLQKKDSGKYLYFNSENITRF